MCADERSMPNNGKVKSMDENGRLLPDKEEKLDEGTRKMYEHLKQDFDYHYWPNKKPSVGDATCMDENGRLLPDKEEKLDEGTRKMREEAEQEFKTAFDCKRQPTVEKASPDGAAPHSTKRKHRSNGAADIMPGGARESIAGSGTAMKRTADIAQIIDDACHKFMEDTLLSAIESILPAAGSTDFLQVEPASLDTISIISVDDFVFKAERLGVEIPAGLKKVAEVSATHAPEPPGMAFPLSAKDVEGQTEVKSLVAPVVLENSVTLLYGCPDSGRTWLALLLGFCAASGTNVFDRWTAEAPIKTLYLCGGLEGDVLGNRVGTVKELFAKENRGRELHAENFMFLSTRRTPLDLSSASGQSRAERLLFPGDGQEGVKLLIVDSLHSLTDFDNSAKYWKALFAWLDGVRRKGCSTLVVHDGDAGDGSSMFGFDSVLHVQREKGVESQELKLSINVERSPVLFKPSDRTLKAAVKLDACVPRCKNITPTLTRQEKDALIVKRYCQDKWSIERIADEQGVTKAAIDKRLRMLKDQGIITTNRKLGRPRLA